MAEYLYDCELKQTDIANKWQELTKKLITENKINK